MGWACVVVVVCHAETCPRVVVDTVHVINSVWCHVLWGNFNLLTSERDIKQDKYKDRGRGVKLLPVPLQGLWSCERTDGWRHYAPCRYIFCLFQNLEAKQVSQWTYNVTLGRVRAAIVALEIIKYYVFLGRVCSLSCPACIANAPYCHLWSLPLYSMFPHYLINGTVLEKKKVLGHKNMFQFSLRPLRHFSF